MTQDESWLKLQVCQAVEAGLRIGDVDGEVQGRRASEVWAEQNGANMEGQSRMLRRMRVLCEKADKRKLVGCKCQGARLEGEDVG